MKKLIGVIIVIFLSAFVAASMFTFPELKDETAQWTLLFFDVIACIQVFFFLWILKKEV